MSNHENSAALDLGEAILRFGNQKFVEAIEAGLFPDIDLIMEAAAIEVDQHTAKVVRGCDYKDAF